MLWNEYSPHPHTAHVVFLGRLGGYIASSQRVEDDIDSFLDGDNDDGIWWWWVE